MLCYIVGNAWTDPAYDNQGAVDFWWTHALISDTIRDGLLHDCNFSGVGPLATVEYGSTAELNKSKVEVTRRSHCTVHTGHIPLLHNGNAVCDLVKRWHADT